MCGARGTRSQPRNIACTGAIRIAGRNRVRVRRHPRHSDTRECFRPIRVDSACGVSYGKEFEALKGCICGGSARRLRRWKHQVKMSRTYGYWNAPVGGPHRTAPHRAVPCRSDIGA